MIEDEEKREERRFLKMFMIAMTFFSLFFAGNIISTRMAADFGLTHSEMSEEVWLVVFYIIAGLFAFVALGRTKWPRPVIFGSRLLLLVLTIALVRNQFAVSKELAGIKREFAIAASHCQVKGEELVCGKELQGVLDRRDNQLKELGVVMLNDWCVTAVRQDTNTLHRAGAYLLNPF